MTIFRSEILDKFGVNMNALAQESRFDPVIHRELEIRSILEILCRKNKNNPVLVGEPGVGKTAIVEKLAMLMVEGQLPNILKDKVIYSLPVSNLVAGTSYRGEFEERLNQILKEVERHRDRIILFIDEIHNTIGTGSAKGSLDISNILKPAISRGEFRLIGATTHKEFQAFIGQDKAFERRFQKVEIPEPDVQTAILMVYGIKSRYEEHHGLPISDDAIVSAVEVAARSIPDRFLPDKALDLIDLTGANLRLDMESMPLKLIQLSQQLSRARLRQDMGFQLDEAMPDTAQLQQEYEALEKQWELEKEVLREEKKLRRLIRTYSKEAREAEKIGYPSKSTEIRENLIPKLESKLAALLERINPERALIYKSQIGKADILSTFEKHFSPSSSNS